MNIHENIKNIGGNMYWIKSITSDGQIHNTLVGPNDNYFGVGEQLQGEGHFIIRVEDQKGRDKSRFLFHHLTEINQCTK